MWDTEERYEMLDLRTGTVRIVDLAAAAEIMEIDLDEILWCIEEFGVCGGEKLQLREA